MVTSTNASVPARPSRTPRSTSQAAKGSERVLAPNAAEKKPARVTPTWTAARKRLGSLSSRCTALPRRPPLSAIPRTWDSRRETRAISAPEKTPPIRTKTTTITMLSQTSLTGGVLLGVVGRYSRPHGAWSTHGRDRSCALGGGGTGVVTFIARTDGDLVRTVSLREVTN